MTNNEIKYFVIGSRTFYPLNITNVNVSEVYKLETTTYLKYNKFD